MSSFTKKKLIEHISHELNERILQTKKSLAAVIESRDIDSKSSAGDKYETGRSMMQIEQQQKELQLNREIRQLKEYEAINFSKESSMVELGSLVYTNKGLFLISIGLGKVELENTIAYAISLQSPLAKSLQNKKEREHIHFRDIKYEIERIE